jgi:hypothetical protein
MRVDFQGWAWVRIIGHRLAVMPSNVEGMSGTYPRDREPVDDPITDPDEALCRVLDLVVSDKDWDEIGPDLNNCLDALVSAGYVEEFGHSPTGSLWRISDAGHDRRAALGRD